MIKLVTNIQTVRLDKPVFPEVENSWFRVVVFKKTHSSHLSDQASRYKCTETWGRRSVVLWKLLWIKKAMPPNKQHGPSRSATECDRKQGRSKTTMLTRREWKSGERTTYRRKGKEIFRQKGRSSWRTKKYGGMKRPFVESFTIRGNGKDPTKTVYSCHFRKDQSHLLSLQTGSSGRDRDESY